MSHLPRPSWHPAEPSGARTARLARCPLPTPTPGTEGAGRHVRLAANPHVPNPLHHRRIRFRRDAIASDRTRMARQRTERIEHGPRRCVHGVRRADAHCDADGWCRRRPILQAHDPDAHERAPHDQRTVDRSGGLVRLRRVLDAARDLGDAGDGVLVPRSVAHGADRRGGRTQPAHERDRARSDEHELGADHRAGDRRRVHRDRVDRDGRRLLLLGAAEPGRADRLLLLTAGSSPRRRPRNHRSRPSSPTASATSGGTVTSPTSSSCRSSS